MLASLGVAILIFICYKFESHLTGTGTGIFYFSV